MAIKPEDDFQGFMEAEAQKAADAEHMEDMMERHRIWRETTWGGFIIRQIQALGDHFAPFFLKVADLVKEQDSAAGILFMTIIRILVIFFGIAMFYFAAHLVQKLIGTEYVVEEEEVILVEDDSNEDGDDKAEDKKEK